MRRSPIINNRWTGPRWSQCFGHIGRLFLWGAFIASLKPNIDIMHTPFSFQPRQNLRCVLHEWLKLLYLLVVLAETWYDLETDREYIWLSWTCQPTSTWPFFPQFQKYKELGTCFAVLHRLGRSRSMQIGTCDVAFTKLECHCQLKLKR